MSSAVRLALIGAGKMARVHAASIAADPSVELVVVAGGSNAPTLAASHGARCSTVEDAFVASDVDAVVVASPNAFHADHVAGAVAGGKAVLVEKPVDLELVRVDALIAEVGEAASRVVVAFNRRFDPSFAEARSRVLAGEVGDLRQLLIVSRDPGPPPLDYVPGSGGIFRDMAIHDLDLARAFVGEIESVSAVGQRTDPDLAALGDFDGATIVLRAASGAIVTILDSRRNAAGYDQRLEAFGPLGVVAVDSAPRTLVRADSATGTHAGAPLISHYGDRYAAAYRAEIAHLAAVARGEAEPIASLRDGRAALLLADAAAESAAGGLEVTVSGRRA